MTLADQVSVLAREGGPLPDDAEILEASLCIFKLTPEYDAELKLFEIQSAWEAAEVNWFQASRDRAWSRAAFDVTEPLRSALKNWGWMIRSSQVNRIFFAGVSHPQADFRPKLVLKIKKPQ